MEIIVLKRLLITVAYSTIPVKMTQSSSCSSYNSELCLKLPEVFDFPSVENYLLYKATVTVPLQPLFNQCFIISRESIGHVWRTFINWILILSSQTLVACEEVEQIKGPLCPQLPLSKRPFTGQDNESIIVQGEHLGWILTERWQCC